MAVEGGRILPEAQLRLLLAPPRAPAEEAFGWRVHTAPDGRDRIDKGGGSDDFASQLLYYPRERVVVIWASNDLRQRWRRALNQVLPGIVFGGAPLQLPPVATLPGATLDRRAGRYIAGRDTLDLIAGAGCLHATANRLAVPTDFMFLPQGPEEFTAFDPATRSITYLTFAGVDGSSLTLTHPDGTRWSARRSSSRKEER
jgi:hypothetical protein